MGRRKKLPQLEILEGNPTKRRVEPVLIEGIGEVYVPRHLSEDAKGLIEVIKRGMPRGVYTSLDSTLIAAYATAWSEHKRAVIAMAAPDFEPIVTNTAGNPTLSPWYKALNSQAQIMASLGDRLGLDPKSRAALHLPAEKPKSKFDGLRGIERERMKSSDTLSS